jgi:hypothetical protein
MMPPMLLCRSYNQLAKSSLWALLGDQYTAEGGSGAALSVVPQQVGRRVCSSSSCGAGLLRCTWPASEVGLSTGRALFNSPLVKVPARCLPDQLVATWAPPCACHLARLPVSRSGTSSVTSAARCARWSSTPQQRRWRSGTQR